MSLNKKYIYLPARVEIYIFQYEADKIQKIEVGFHCQVITVITKYYVYHRQKGLEWT